MLQLVNNYSFLASYMVLLIICLCFFYPVFMVNFNVGVEPALLNFIDAKLPKASIVMHLAGSFMAEELDDVTENNVHS